MENNIYNIKGSDLTYGRGYVYSLQYHIVWCTKYRKQVLKDGIETELKAMLESLADEYSFTILAMEVMPCKKDFFHNCNCFLEIGKIIIGLTP